MKRGPKSKIGNIDLDQLYILASAGFTDAQISEFFKISRESLDTYKNANPKILDTLKTGKELSDNRVVRSLFERANGYQHPEDKIFCEGGRVTVVPTIKHYPPDPTSMIFWLKNRKSKDWKDRVEHTGADGDPIKFNLVNYSGIKVPTELKVRSNGNGNHNSI